MELDLEGAYKIQPFYATDERGGFVKDYNIDMFRANGIVHELKEVFYTISKRGVIRATHFQLVKQQDKVGIGIRPDDGIKYDFSMFDTTPLKEAIGDYVSTPFEKGIKKTINWLKTTE